MSASLNVNLSGPLSTLLSFFATMKLSKEESEDSGTLFFLSYDLVNSTEFKARYPEDWIGKVNNFYDGCIAGVKTKFDYGKSCFLWKKNGDEVLFYFKAEDIKKLYSHIESVFDILKELIHKVQEGKGAGVLSVKATLWTAHVSTNKQTKTNLVLSNEGIRDFIGPDIDFGFRIAAKNAPSIICVDPKIVAMFEAESLVTDHYRVVDYVQLKGVWKGRYVPIIWYHPEINNPETFMPYDEAKRNELVKELAEGCKNTNSSKMKKILADIGELEQFNLLIASLSTFEIAPDPTSALNSERSSETHIVAILFNESLDKAFCALRAKDKPNFPDCWGFGCAQLKPNKEKIGEQLAKYYQSGFGIKVCEIFGTEISPVVVTSYGFEDNVSKRWIPGFIFAGIADETQPVFNSEKYTEAKWITLEEIQKKTLANIVPGFYENIEKALNIAKSNL